MYDKCYFCLDQLPKLKKESTASFFVNFGRSRGTKEPTYITVYFGSSNHLKRSQLSVGFRWEGSRPPRHVSGIQKSSLNSFPQCSSSLHCLFVEEREVCVWFPQKASEQIPATKIPHKTVEVVFETDSRKYK